MPPPEKLFIYEIQGRVTRRTTSPGTTSWAAGGRGGILPLLRRPGKGGAGLGGHPTAARYSSENVMNYADWEAGQPLKPPWRGFTSARCGRTPTPAAGELVIRMEPGLAFGSGYHPTTRRCLELLRRVYDTDAPRQVLDLGTGTGILALAALALGARAGDGGGVQRTGGADLRPEPEA